MTHDICRSCDCCNPVPAFPVFRFISTARVRGGFNVGGLPVRFPPSVEGDFFDLGNLGVMK